ncbi:hypothetical protein DYU05_03870 [Mucilaginibacter terrenus]|uniref:Uncharacterized protein n=1 Tax=Mucilaginibacter terrenus TaxID=2482727 RepID=A0A3E2NUS0_9SPHI|nr:hypothetical protein [Mucilaginibacter terrenus]RFZ84753.1 hypothetical protein DYU05_03870 [Mucilaginibacter terrenus]
MFSTLITNNTLLQLAGLGQVSLALGSLFIPGVLKWRSELSKVNPLIKQMFWVYAAYIFVINLSFGLLSIFCSNDLLSHSRLATIVTGFIAVYWLSRVAIQFFYFDRSALPSGKWQRVAEVVLVLLFTWFSLFYSFLFYVNLKGL